ncbi:(Fe-S)-binding protein [Thermodesulforhabdus norvegica]|uniref:Glycolate oxidase iron-sulfur subunit n=1 Tax=Thermodesulforhabdus norvegica TaxID=39841 RepID=A0A1I4W6B4_9BACT|nr:(Fe-S)-binding protein [Thermodesulforhabdus norvegica]SFN09158.1 glycolate oxidase iron-sulfur subunit [Thermodesulforhabdus norvegica]
MASIGKLIKMLESLEDDLIVCMRCGMCQSVCPLYRETRLETDVARGKLAILDGLRKSLFEKPDGVAQRLHRCLLCGSCQAQCPSGVKSVEIFLKARAIISEYRGLSPLKRLILRKILAVPERFHRLLDIMARCQKLFFKDLDPVVGTSCSRIPVPPLGKRHITPLAAVPFHEKVPALYRPATGGITVAVFTGCLIDRVFPSVAEALIRILEKEGMGIHLPEGQSCCGIPALSAGDLNTFKSLVRRNLESFAGEGYDVLVTACATCTAVIKELWPVMMEGEGVNISGKAKSLSEKTMDVTEFLFKYGHMKSSEKKAGPLKVTYHDPCHLKKSLGIWKEPRRILESLDRYSFIEMVEADSCCGLGGSFGLEHEELSEKIGLKKAQRIIDTGADVVATACPACMIQLADMLSRTGKGKKVKHVVELYAESL